MEQSWVFCLKKVHAFQQKIIIEILVQVKKHVQEHISQVQWSYLSHFQCVSLCCCPARHHLSIILADMSGLFPFEFQCLEWFQSIVKEFQLEEKLFFFLKIVGFLFGFDAEILIQNEDLTNFLFGEIFLCFLQETDLLSLDVGNEGSVLVKFPKQDKPFLANSPDGIQPERSSD